MTAKELVRIENEARRMRAEVLTGMIRSLFGRTPRAQGTAAQTV